MELIVNFRGKKIPLSAYAAFKRCKARVEVARAAGLKPDLQDEYDYLNFIGAMTNSEKKKMYEKLKDLKEKGELK